MAVLVARISISLAFAQSGSVMIIAGENHVSTYGQRLGLIRKLDGRLASGLDRQAFSVFLSKPLETERVTEGELATLKNDTADSLLGQYPNWQELHDSLLNTMSSTNQGTIWPSYILQKLPTIIKQLDDATRDKALNILWGIAEERK